MLIFLESNFSSIDVLIMNVYTKAVALLGRVDASQLSFTGEFVAASASAVRLVVAKVNYFKLVTP